MAARTDSPQPASPERRPELDAIRMLVVIAGVGVVWAMPLLFLISGYGSASPCSSPPSC
jgi:hypothetical protein